MSDSLSSTSSDCSSTCTVHGHCVVYYCRDCRVTVCGTCVTDSSHRKHEFETLTKGFELHIEAVAERVKTLNKTMKEQTNIKPRVLKARDELEDMFNLAKEKVAEQYHELRELMDQNMQQAFMLILALRERMIQDTDQLVQFGEEYEEKRKHIQCSVKALKGRRTQMMVPSFRIEEIEDYHRNVFEIITFDKQRLKALEHSISKIVQMNKDLLPRPWEFGENITFDDGASHEHLKISRDKTKVQYVASQSSNKRRKRKQIETVFNVLASQSFTEGRHYWEVNVKNTKCWTVGVVEKDWVKKGIKQVLGQDMLSWVLQMDGDSLVALHKHDTTMITEAVIERLGVFLDFKKGRLQFFNVHRGTVLHTFVEKFKNPLVPAFSIESQKGSTPEMRLCVLVLRDMDRNYDSGQRRESTDSGNGRAFNSSSSATGRSSQSSSPLTTESTARL